MSLARALGAAVGTRLRLVIAGAREARAAYRAEMQAAAPPSGPPGDPAAPLDPRLAEYYANLELPPGAGLAEVQRAWKKLVRDYHPDRHAANPARQAAATRLVQELNHAYRELAAHLAKTRS